MIVTPPELRPSTHPRPRGDGERSGLEIAVQHSGRQELDLRGVVDIALDLAGDRDRLGPNAAGDFCALLDREVAVDVDVTLESSGDPDMPGADDLAGDRDVSGDNGLLRLARRDA